MNIILNIFFSYFLTAEDFEFLIWFIRYYILNYEFHLLQIFKRVIIPCAAGVSGADNLSASSACGKKSFESGTKPSDLPIYSKTCSEWWVDKLYIA